MPTQLQAVLILLGVTAIAVCLHLSHRIATSSTGYTHRRNFQDLSLDDDHMSNAEPAAHPSTPPSQTRPTIVQLDTTTERTLPMTTATTAPPPIRSASVDSWQSEVVFKGYVYNFKRVCIHRNRVMFLRGEFPRPQDSQKMMGWMFIDSHPRGAPASFNFSDASRVTVYAEPTLLIAGASTGPKANPTHSLFNIFGSFSIGMQAGNTPGAPYNQVFYHTPGRTVIDVRSVWDGAFAQEMGLLSPNATMLIQPDRSTVACFENLVGSRISQDPDERIANRGQWYRQLHENLMERRPPIAKGCEIVVMDRTEMPTRRWANAQPLVDHLRAHYPAAKVHFFNSQNPLATLTPRQQFSLFANATMFVGPQGGVEAWAHSHGLLDAMKHEWHVWASTFRDDHLAYQPGHEFMRNNSLPTNTHRRAVKTLNCLDDWPEGTGEHIKKVEMQRSFEVTHVRELFTVVDSISSGPCSELKSITRKSL